MKLWWSLWLLDLVHAAKVRPSVVTAPLNLLVQEPGLEASNHTLFNTLGDKESALALMNATGEHHSAMFIDGGDEGIMEHDMDEHGMDAMDDFHEDHETDHGMDEHYDDHYDEHYDHDSHDDMHFDPEENSLALASEKGMSYLNSSMNSTSAMGWRCRHGCRSCKRWNRNWCTSCHNGWRKYGHKCHPRHCDGKICKSCPGFWHRKALCCEAVACPTNSKGDDVAKGCTCDAGFAGSVTAIAQSPYYQNGCTAVQCPTDSSGTDVPTGCTCDAGFSGSITASSASPFFTGSCQAVACPKDSSGTNVPSGCKCLSGFSGAVLAIQATPFHTSTCAPVACPSHSTGTD